LIKKPFSTYLHSKYPGADAEIITTTVVPVNDSNYTPQKPAMRYDMEIYVNENKTRNRRSVIILDLATR